MTSAFDLGHRPKLIAAAACFYLIAGLFHLSLPDPFLSIMPSLVPFPRTVVALTGVCELLGACGLLFSPTRKASATALAVYAICVFPANIQHAIIDLHRTTDGLGWWYHAPRLVLQPVLVYWPLYASGLANGITRNHSRMRHPIAGEE